MANKKYSKAAEQKKKQQQEKIITYSLLGILCIGILVGVIFGIASNREKEIVYIDADPNLTYYADIVIKKHGTITVKLDQSAAPKTVSNFISLAESGFYDGLTFHRIIDGFMMQGGDPNANGTGGADKTIVGEFNLNGHNNPISHKRGVISMARSEAYNSASSQFFIVHEDSTDSLDGKYAAFGYVISGMDIVDEICENTPAGYNGAVNSEDQPVIKKITIRTE